MEPTIGRIVHFTHNGELVPAIIVKVHNVTCVNLHVFYDDVHPAWVQKSTQGTGQDQWQWPEIEAPVLKKEG